MSTDSAEGVQNRMLFVLDFDGTVVEGWSDSWILEVVPDLKLAIPQPLLSQCSGSWLGLMNRVMQLIHESGFGKERVISHMKTLELKKWASVFLQSTMNHPSVDVIILSDGNTQFISAVLEGSHCSEAVKETYANPATFKDDGKLTINSYHCHNCPRCTTYNAIICKGAVLSNILSLNNYEKVVYVGDGENDICPCLGLTEKDSIVAWNDKALANQLQDIKPSAQLFTCDFNDHVKMHSILTELLPN